jgi:hypothetical protein
MEGEEQEEMERRRMRVERALAEEEEIETPIAPRATLKLSQSRARH